MPSNFTLGFISKTAESTFGWGSKKFDGIKKNLSENYLEKIKNNKVNDNKKKDETSLNIAFELYMIKNFLNVNLDQNNEDILKIWESEFDKKISKHKENQNQNFQLIRK